MISGTRRALLRTALAIPAAGLLRLTRAQQPGPAPADDSGRPVDAPPKDFYPYRGISGPGLPVTDASAVGGWVSGAAGVRDQGAMPLPYPTLAG